MGELAVGTILAVVTLHLDRVSGGAPIFLAGSEEEQEKSRATWVKYWMRWFMTWKTGPISL